MHIAHYYGHSGTNGVTWMVLDTSRRLRERGHPVHLLCRKDSALAAHLPASTYRHLGGLHRLWLRSWIRGELRRVGAEVLNVHSQRDADLALAAARDLGIPSFYTCHELSEAAGRLAPRADRVIAVSAGVGQFLRSRHGIRDSVLHVIPNGVDLQPLPDTPREALRRESGFGADEVWLGFTGRIVRNKNVTGLIQAYATAAAEVPQLRLLIIGGGPQETAAREIAGRLGVAGMVRFTGWLQREQVFRFTGALDALVVPSLAGEGLSTAMLSAMALGVPVIATDLPSLKGGPLREGETGWLAPDAGVPSLAATLARAGGMDPARRALMGANARREMLAHYQMSRVADDMETAYRAACPPKPAG